MWLIILLRKKSHSQTITLQTHYTFWPHVLLYTPIAFSLEVDVSSREFKLFFLASDNRMIMVDGDPPGIETEKSKKTVKVERVNILGSEV